MYKQGKFTEGGAVFALNDSSRTKVRLFIASDAVEGGSGLLDDQRAEHAVLLVGIREQVIVKENGFQFCVGKKPQDAMRR